MFRRSPAKYRPGDRVIYRLTKRSEAPGPRARDLRPAEGGDEYAYHVDKFWTVVETHDDGTVVIRTRRGKVRRLHSSDPRLRRAWWWERWFYADRFPELTTFHGENN